MDGNKLTLKDIILQTLDGMSRAIGMVKKTETVTGRSIFQSPRRENGSISEIENHEDIAHR